MIARSRAARRGAARCKTAKRERTKTKCGNGRSATNKIEIKIQFGQIDKTANRKPLTHSPQTYKFTHCNAIVVGGRNKLKIWHQNARSNACVNADRRALRIEWHFFFLFLILDCSKREFNNLFVSNALLFIASTPPVCARALAHLMPLRFNYECPAKQTKRQPKKKKCEKRKQTRSFARWQQPIFASASPCVAAV